MKKKGTKLYQSLVDKYCDARHRFERRQSEVDGYNADIERAKNKFESLPVNLHEDEDIKEWYNVYTSAFKSLIGMVEYGIRTDKEAMETSGDMLVDEYGDNLDELYNSREF
jgi:hypothetical protein